MEEHQKLDPFDRQLNILDWDQSKLRDSKVLLLGVGGLGSVVLMHLLRVGVGKIRMVDYDVVCRTNLNRQLMFSMKDVGKLKVEAAYENSSIHNIGNTEVIPFNFDATKNWEKIVELAKDSDVIFNLIDHGDHWDAAVQSLAFSIGIPHILGGNYENNVSVDYFPSKPEHPCFLCVTDNLKQDMVDQITPDKIQSLKDISFLPQNEKPKSKSYPMLCTTCGVFIANFYKNHLFTPESERKTQRVLFYMNDLCSVSWDVSDQKRADCKICSYKPEEK